MLNKLMSSTVHVVQGSSQQVSLVFVDERGLQNHCLCYLEVLSLDLRTAFPPT